LLRFRHDLVRAAAYGGLSFKRRREIHARVGEALERHVGDAEEIAALLSLHFLAAGEFDKAWGYAVAAGDDARAKYANVDAAILYERALAAAGDLTANPAATADVAESLGDVYELTARFELAAGAYGRAASDADDPTTMARRRRKQGIVDERLGHYEDARARYDAALAQGDAVEQTELVEVENAIATVLYRQGKIEECVEWCERATDRARSAGDRRGLAHAYYVRAAAEGNRSGPARDFLELALPIYEEIGDLVSTSNILSNMGVPAYYAGDWEEAIRCYAAGRTMAQRAGHVVGAANATNNEAEVLIDQGRLAEARALLDDALRAYRAAGFAMGAALATLNLGRAAALAGEYGDATELLAEARSAFEEMGADSFAFTARARQAEALVLEGHHSAALDLAADTLAVSLRAGEHGTLTAQLERLLGYGHAQARATEDARPHFEASLAVARKVGASYEEALTLRALADTKLGGEAERQAAGAILDRLGVASLPDVPLP
jgi:tetratricopeptide (TPR) repeat protein